MVFKSVKKFLKPVERLQWVGLGWVRLLRKPNTMVRYSWINTTLDNWTSMSICTTMFSNIIPVLVTTWHCLCSMRDVSFRASDPSDTALTSRGCGGVRRKALAWARPGHQPPVSPGPAPDMKVWPCGHQAHSIPTLAWVKITEYVCL